MSQYCHLVATLTCRSSTAHCRALTLENALGTFLGVYSSFLRPNILRAFSTKSLLCHAERRWIAVQCRKEAVHLGSTVASLRTTSIASKPKKVSLLRQYKRSDRQYSCKAKPVFHYIAGLQVTKQRRLILVERMPMAAYSLRNATDFMLQEARRAESTHTLPFESPVEPTRGSPSTPTNWQCNLFIIIRNQVGRVLRLHQL